MLVDALTAANRRSPHDLAVADGVRALSYNQLTRLASIFRDIIARETTSPRVGVMLPASSAFPAVLFGILWSPKIAVPLNFLLSAEELTLILEDADIDTIITIRHFAKLVADLPAKAIFLEDLPLKRRMILGHFRRIPRAPQVDPHATAVILYTSGTTAAPKGVELTQRNLHSNCVDTIAAWNVDPQQIFLNILPPFHVFGLTATVLIPVVLGATVHAIPRFSPAAVMRSIVANRISVIMAIPSMYAALLRAKSAKRESLRSIYLAISGGEPLPDRVRSGFQDRFGITILEGYGLTEASPIITASSPDAQRPGSVGRPIHNVQIRVVGPNGRTLSAGEAGEILVRGPGVMKGYYRRPEETRRVIDSDGWLATGDVGRLDDDGFLTITGRAKEMLIIGGENVFPREIEAVLEGHEAVSQIAVIGVPDELRGEVPAAFVIPKPGADVTEQELRSYAKQSLAGFKVPKHIVIREDLPHGATGKILKRRLQELL